MEHTINKINKYTHTSSDEFDGYEEALTGVLRLHKDKLDAYLEATSAFLHDDGIAVASRPASVPRERRPFFRAGNLSR